VSVADAEQAGCKMTVQFVLGRSGSGKTSYCIESIQSELVRNGEGEGLILLVPEQATFQMEQALLAGDRLKGYHRAYVMSFRRLALEVLAQTQPPAAAIISEMGKQMILRRLLQELGGRLKIFERLTQSSGFITQLSRMISELRYYQKQPVDLRRQEEELRGDGRAEELPLADKLGDLAVIYQGYLDYMEGRFVDPDEFLNLMVQQCGQATILREARLWVDGFSSFTPQQYAALGAVMTYARRTEISLCLDPASREFKIANQPDGAVSEMDLFHLTLETYQRLVRMLRERQINIEKPLLLPLSTMRETAEPVSAKPKSAKPGGVMLRFAQSRQLGMLEQNIFSSAQRSDSLDDGGAEISEIADEEIVIVEAANRRAEVEAAAGQIVRLCRDKGYRFREIAVILRDFQDYQPLLEAAFEDYGIAYFMDQRRSVQHHPLVALLRSGLGALVSDFKSEEVFNYLKTDLAPVGRAEVDTLENYVLAHGIDGQQWYAEKVWQERKDSTIFAAAGDNEESKANIDDVRRRAVAPLVRMRQGLWGGSEFAAEKKLPVRKITTLLVELLEELEVGGKLAEWYRQAKEAGQLDAAQTHEQLYEDVMELLDDVVEALDGCEVTLGEYAVILNSGLEQMTLRLVPPAMDQVLVGTIERSRHPQIRAALVLGVNEGGFPKVSVPEAFLSDEQREKLRQGGFELAEGSTEKLLHERYLAYIAFTRPKERLWVSYPRADEKGSKLNPSRLIEDIQNAVKGVRVVRAVDDDRADSKAITTAAQLGRQLAAAMSQARAGRAVEEVWGQLYRYSQRQPGLAEDMGKSLAGASYRNTASLDKEIVERLYPQELRSSVSRLESFAACPFQYFAGYVLNLQPREELKLAAPDLGGFYHECLCEIFHRMQQEKITWQQITDGRLDEIVRQVFEAVTERNYKVAQLWEKAHRNRYLLQSAMERLKGFCRSLRSMGQAGDFVQEYAEREFGFDEAAADGEMEIAAGKRLILRGKIDRVDTGRNEGGELGIRIIDYKSSAKSFAYAWFYHGLTLQLISYLQVMQENYQKGTRAEVRPAAALFIPINRQGTSHDEPPPANLWATESSAEQGQEIAHKANGIINRDWMSRLDHTVEPGQMSKYFNFGITKEGAVRDQKRSGVVSSDELARMLNYCRGKLAELAGGILSGNIAVSPYRVGGRQTPCPNCEYQSFCRFDFSCDRYRNLPSYPKAEVLERIKSYRAKGAGDE